MGIATRRKELTELFLANDCNKVVWMFPEETGFYQPIAVVRKGSCLQSFTDEVLL